ncbi:hypothetical protein [Pseudomonas proteolytica]|uniref:hypothetical protein n=1 Tax=Pseudomonas proteolytica TaxID=219574 RepID=UPI0014764A3F|nr:hypothetical protein [Pseudomonas proteolytica]NMY95231.1 hypothetical protein [Pseudomonas proteolytica]
MNRTLVIELNEFNASLLRQAADRFNLKYIKEALSWSHCETQADHDKEHSGLDPWCQWVSIHTEQPSANHNVIRLGDVDKLQYPQVWERLGEQGISTGVWGVMNARRNNAPLNYFFTTDPWNFTESPFPQNIAGFFALPVYFSKNYMDLSYFQTVRAAFSTLKTTLFQLPFVTLMKDLAFVIRMAKGAKLNTCFLFGAFELLSARLFLKFRNKHDPEVSFIFLNLIAHFQHHDWALVDGVEDSSRAVFSFLDRILGALLNEVPGPQSVLLLNAFTQRNVSEEEFYCYRQINPLKFLQRIGMNPSRVEQCMTNDGHAFFRTEDDCQKAANCLQQARVGNAQAFAVEVDPQQPNRLFYQFSYWGAADSDTVLEIAGEHIRLLSEFALHAKRTGAHVREGNAFYRGIELPLATPNYEVFGHVWPRSGSLD